MIVSETLPPLKGTDEKICFEITTLVHGHGGTDFWAYGRAIWSPSRDKAGKDIYGLMRLVKKGELVLHLLKGSSTMKPIIPFFMLMLALTVTPGAASAATIWDFTITGTNFSGTGQFEADGASVDKLTAFHFTGNVFGNSYMAVLSTVDVSQTLVIPGTNHLDIGILFHIFMK